MGSVVSADTYEYIEFIPRSAIQLSCSITNLLRMNQYSPANISRSAIKLQATLSAIEVRIVDMTMNSIKNKKLALEHKATDVNTALHYLKLMKLYDKEIAKMQGLKIGVEANKLQLESAGVMIETVAALKETAGNFQSIQSKFDIAKLEKNIDVILDTRELSDEWMASLTEASGDEMTNTALLLELEELGTSQEERISPQSPVKDEMLGVMEFPDVPSDTGQAGEDNLVSNRKKEIEMAF